MRTRNRAPWYRIRPANRESRIETAEVELFGDIGRGWFAEDGITAEDFRSSLAEIPKDQEILLSIHSRGGDVWDALAIYSMLLERRDHLRAKVVGVAFSAASFIAMAAREVEIPEAGRMMIHDAQGLVIGNSDALREAAELLDEESDNIAAIYAEKTGDSVSAMRKLMRETTWMNGKQALERGFVDVVTKATPRNCAFDLSIFRRVPVDLRNHAATTRRTSPTSEAMNRKQILAFLKRHGITPADDASDLELQAALDSLEASGEITPEARARFGAPAPAAAATPPAPSPARAPAPLVPANANPATAPAPTPVPLPTPQPAADVTNRIAELERQLTVERTTRVTNRLNEIASDRNIDVATWLPRAMADEAVLADLERLPRMSGAPLGARLQNMGNALYERYRAMKPGAARQAFSVENYHDLERVMAAMRGPRNANTIDSGLIPAFLSDALIVVANQVLAPLRAFSRSISLDPLRPGAAIAVKKSTAASAAQTNPTNFESGDSTLATISVTVAQISKSYHVSNADRNNGFALKDLAEKSAHVFVNAISDIWTALLIAANYPTPLVVGAATDFAPDDLRAIWAAAKNFTKKNLVLDGGHMGYLIPLTRENFSLNEVGGYGFDLLAQQNRWTGAVANTVGFVCAPDALAVASGLPNSLPAEEFNSLSTVVIEPIGLAVQVAEWFSRAGRVNWASFDVMFGAAVGDATQAEILVTA